MKSFNFGEALSFMEIGETVCLELDGKTRLYRMQDGEIICNVGHTVEKRIRTKRNETVGRFALCNDMIRNLDILLFYLIRLYVHCLLYTSRCV